MSSADALWFSIWWDIQGFVFSEVFFLTVFGNTESNEMNFKVFFLIATLDNPQDRISNAACQWP